MQKNRDRARAYWYSLTPEQRASRAHGYYLKSGGRAQAKWRDENQKYTCIQCGVVRTLGTNIDRATYLCQQCKHDAREKLCAECGKRAGWTPDKSDPRDFCSVCAGLQTRVAVAIGTSRERVRQLIRKAQVNHNLGYVIAALKVMDERGVRFREARRVIYG